METYNNPLHEFITTVNNEPITVHVGFGRFQISNENYTFNARYHLLKDAAMDRPYDDEESMYDTEEMFDSLKYEFDYFNVEAIDNIGDNDEEFELTLDDIVLIQDSINVEIVENEEDDLDEIE